MGAWSNGVSFEAGIYHLVNIWKITMRLMGKSTISMAIFNSYVNVYQRVRLKMCCYRLSDCRMIVWRFFHIIPIWFATLSHLDSLCSPTILSHLTSTDVSWSHRIWRDHWSSYTFEILIIYHYLSIIIYLSLSIYPSIYPSIINNQDLSFEFLFWSSRLISGHLIPSYLPVSVLIWYDPEIGRASCRERV